jgi:hypothetical protein
MLGVPPQTVPWVPMRNAFLAPPPVPGVRRIFLTYVISLAVLMASANASMLSMIEA